MAGKKNVLVIGHPADTDKYLARFAHDGLVRVHHTVSHIGLQKYIEEARRLGAPLVAMDIDEWPMRIKDDLVVSLAKDGGIRCIAYAGICPCDDDWRDKDGPGFANGCRCTKRQLEQYNTVHLNCDEFGTVFNIVELGDNRRQGAPAD